MNDEQLEKLLRDIPTPELPESWRAPILTAAIREARTAEAVSSPRQTWPTLLVYLRNLFRQNPITATALAMLWVLIFVFKVGTPIDPSSKALLAHIDPNRPINFVSLSEEIQLVELWQEEPQRRQMP